MARSFLGSIAMAVTENPIAIAIVTAQMFIHMADLLVRVSLQRAWANLVSLAGRTPGGSLAGPVVSDYDVIAGVHRVFACMPDIMIRCPVVGVAVQTGLSTETIVLRSLPNISY